MRTLANKSGVQMMWATILLIGALALPTAAQAGEMTFKVTDLGTLPGASDSHVTGLNNQGQVVGQSGTGQFLYGDGAMTALNYGDYTQVGISDSGPYAITSPDFAATRRNRCQNRFFSRQK